MANRDDDRITRGELHDALRFLHMMGTQNRLDLDRVDAILAALVRTLLETHRLDPARVEALLPETRAKLEERAQPGVAVSVGPAIDKYTLASPDIDCVALFPLCQARCCRLTFPLSFQDLDEGKVRWDYRRPYQIRQNADGVCVHSDRATGGCGVYAARPATCRKYDCRNDPRIWDDYEKRIPAPMERLTALVQLRKSRDAGLRMEPDQSDDESSAAG